MFFVTRRVGGGSAKYFIRQQKALGRVEGFIEEMMNGQKVIKVFCREEEVKKDLTNSMRLYLMMQGKQTAMPIF